MTSDEKQSVIDLQGSPGFRVIQHIMEQKIKQLDSVSEIDLKAQVPLAIQALAHKKAVELLRTFLTDINFVPTIKKDNTYE